MRAEDAAARPQPSTSIVQPPPESHRLGTARMGRIREEKCSGHDPHLIDQPHHRPHYLTPGSGAVAGTHNILGQVPLSQATAPRERSGNTSELNCQLKARTKLTSQPRSIQASCWGGLRFLRSHGPLRHTAPPPLPQSGTSIPRARTQPPCPPSLSSPRQSNTQ